MDVIEFREAIANCDPEAFCQDRLFDMHSWLFEESGLGEITGTYEDFRDAISNSIAVSPDAVRLVGSSKFGVSMSPAPEKFLREFHDESDLDVVVISEELFETVWTEFRTAYYNGYGWIKNRHGSDIFRRFLYLLPGDRYDSAYLRNASRRMDGMSRDVLLRTGLARSLKYRIYASWPDAVGYHAYGIKKLQRALIDVA